MHCQVNGHRNWIPLGHLGRQCTDTSDLAPHQDVYPFCPISLWWRVTPRGCSALTLPGCPAQVTRESLQGGNSKIWPLEMLNAEAMRDRYQQGLSERHKHYLTHLTWIYWEVLHSGWYWAKNFVPSYRKTPTNFLTYPINSWNSCPPRAYGLTRGPDGSRDSSAMWRVMMRLQEIWYHREWGGVGDG